MKIRLLPFLANCLCLAFSGCATHSTLVIARCGPQPIAATARKIALMMSPQPRPEDESLKQCVAAELERSGFQIVPQAEADFILSSAVEDNWHSYKHRTDLQPFSHPLPAPTMWQSGGVVYREQWRSDPPITPTYTEEHIATQGIRLRFYPSQTLRAGRFEAAWEGYIEAGLELRAEHQPLLLKTLFGYFGHNYSGRARLAE